MLNGGSMVWGFCVYFVYMIPLETDVLRKHRFQKDSGVNEKQTVSWIMNGVNIISYLILMLIYI